jgi:hypothetical protein
MQTMSKHIFSLYSKPLTVQNDQQKIERESSPRPEGPGGKNHSLDDVSDVNIVDSTIIKVRSMVNIVEMIDSNIKTQCRIRFFALV